ncbi:MAG: DUF1848 domain-containing protein [Firmicutes bacterium]|nr:DUF1848 domain-containing protein [Bacillota bacterium]
MRLSASRRTDIPAIYGDWFFERLKAGHFFVPNPFIDNEKIAKINVEPVRVETNILGGQTVTGNIDGIVFWTKNPRPFLPRLDELTEYKYYFLFTLNPYDAAVEQKLPSLAERIKTFQELSRTIGAERVIWRYDPILFTRECGVKWHIEQFANLAAQLEGYTKCCKISFLLGKHPRMFAPNFDERRTLVKSFAECAAKNGIQIETCALSKEFSDFGIKKSSCIDPELWEYLLGAKRKSKTLDSQRKECLCMPSVDIGIYNTCTNGCLYCYANGFYGYRGESKSLTDKLAGEVYERKIERSFNY